MSTTIDYTFEWPAGPNDVIVTGEFDDWKGSLPLLKTSTGEFELTFPVKIPADKDKVFFKYIVDGDWVTSDAYNKGFDETGIENNYVSKIEAQALSENPSASKIPEAGGLAFASVTASAAKKTEEPKPTPDAAPKTVSLDEPKTAAKTSTTSEPAVLDFSTNSAITATKTENSEPSTTKAVSEPKPAATPTIATKTASADGSKPSAETGSATITAKPEITGTTKIPEAGGLGFATKASTIEPTRTASSSESKKRFKVKRRIRRNKETGEKVVVSEERIPLGPNESTPEHIVIEEESLKSRSDEPEDAVHILPIDAQTKPDQFNPPVGGPGPVIPQNASEIKEFSEVRDVDAKALNERLNGESQAKENAEVAETGPATLDPNTQPVEGDTSKKVVSNTESKVAPAADKADKAAAKKEAQPSSSKPVKKSTKKSTASGPKTEEKKKKTSFFGKLKKVLQ